ncbi:MAG: hypothetical protein K2X77_16830 [Candidatus Obscuribacterales bacterium]|jgi:hypothetical protein|nr:hypothetical protein [Candidatus Obscuribacterales bacterium]
MKVVRELARYLKHMVKFECSCGKDNDPGKSGDSYQDVNALGFFLNVSHC